MTEEIITTVVNEAKSQIYSSGMIILWASFFIFNFLITLLLKKKNTNWGRYWATWFLTALVTGIILIFLVASPEKVAQFFTSVKNFFNLG